MRKQLQGIAFILFGMLLVLIAMLDPWVPILDGAVQPLLLLLGLVMGIVGLALSLSKDKTS
ncbi:MAG: hypothetical protein HDT33_04185 [Clostridiales bacterium]|nr:hypothetical protein [Clostridiales bacterium]